jgi:hypothetical protein
MVLVMPDKIQSSRVICEGGLDSTENYLNLSANKPGAATRLVNYEVGLSGGYRRINGYEAYDTDFAEVGEGDCEGKVLGIIMFENTVSGSTDIIAARKLTGVDEYKLYKHEFGTGWVEIVTGLTHSFVLGGATVDKLRYDQGSDGTTNYLCIVDGVNPALLYDGTNWVFIESTNTGLAYATAGGPQAVDAPALVSFFSSMLFLGGDLVNNVTGVLAYSAPNAFFDFLSASGAGQAVAGFPVVAIKPFRDNLYVFGYNAIKRVFSDVDAGVLVKDVTNNIGIMSRDAVVEIGGDLVFLAPDGFRPIAGTDKIGDVQLETLSKSIHTLIKNRIQGNVGFEVNTVAIRGKSQFRMFFGGDNFDANDSRGIIGALRSADQNTGWEFGELLGFRASCATSRYVNGEEVVLHGDYDGNVYQQEEGNSLNGSDMLSVYSTPYLDMGDTEVRKVFEKVIIFMRGEGDLGITIGVDYDWGDTAVPKPANYDIDISGTLPTYDDPDVMYGSPSAVYGGLLTPHTFKDIQGSFFSARLTFTTTGTEFPHSIYGIILEYQVKGRR